MGIIGGTAALALIVFAAVSFGGFGKKVVGKNIDISKINDFYYTYSTSTNPPHYQRYRFYKKNGTYKFFHDKREGDHWPLREEDSVLSGTIEISEDTWKAFFDLLEGGEVVKRTEHLESGDPGPWLYLYWTGDKGKIQEFSFASPEKKLAFKEFCEKLVSGE